MKPLVVPEEAAYTAGGLLLPAVSVIRGNSDLLTRFWRKVRTPSGDGKTRKGKCWEWTAGSKERGYGRFTLANEGIRLTLAAHRVSFALHNGYWASSSLMILHACDNPCCVNPHHLRAGTAAENNEECRAKGRWRNQHGGRRVWVPDGVDNWSARGVEKILRGSSKLTPWDVQRIRRESQDEGDQLLLAFEYDVTADTIAQVAAGKRFAWVHGETI